LWLLFSNEATFEKDYLEAETQGAKVMMQAGRLRHVISIQKPVLTQDELNQDSTEFEDLYTDVRAEIVPLSGREYVAAKQVNAEVTTRMTLRRLPNIEANCRVVHMIESDDPPTKEVYDILAVLPDPVSGLRYLTLMCVQRFSEGWRRGS
jgi:SPP1 family predicted phage head-tail adaptor